MIDLWSSANTEYIGFLGFMHWIHIVKTWSCSAVIEQLVKSIQKQGVLCSFGFKGYPWIENASLNWVFWVI